MFDSDETYKKKQALRDEKRLAKHRAEDDRHGPPSIDVLTHRAVKAITKGYTKTALEAIRQGAYIDARVTFKDAGVHHDQPLILVAARHFQTEVVQELVKKGADRAAQARWARGENHSRFPILSHIADMGNVDAMKALLDGGTQGLEDQLDRALIVAVQSYRRNELVPLLLDKGAKNHQEALSMAERYTATDEIKKMIRASAAKCGQPLPPPGGHLLDDAEGKIVKILDGVTEMDRHALLVRLKEKYAADFEAAVRPWDPVPQPGTQAPLQKKPKNALNM